MSKDMYELPIVLEEYQALLNGLQMFVITDQALAPGTGINLKPHLKSGEWLKTSYVAVVTYCLAVPMPSTDYVCAICWSAPPDYARQQLKQCLSQSS